jgi:RNA polymerase sigma-70 factor, ECF subfamily
MGNSPLSSLSSSLWHRALANDGEAWTNIVKVFGPLLEQWLTRLNVPADDIEDVRQETFQALFRSLRHFDRDRAGATFRGWLWTVTKNQSLDFHRRRAMGVKAAGGSTANELLQAYPAEVDDSSGPPPEAEENGVLRRALDLIRAEFNENTWCAFFLTAVEEKSAGDVARTLNMSVGHVYVAKSRVLKRLREELGEWFD